MKSWSARILLVALAAVFLSASPALSYTVDAFSNSSSGGTGVNTGIALIAGQQFTVTVARPTSGTRAPCRGGQMRMVWWEIFMLQVRMSRSRLSIRSLAKIGAHTPKTVSLLLMAPWWQNRQSYHDLLGTSFSGLAVNSGTLTLFYWDSLAGDNTNSVHATVNAVPVPAAVWLLGTGLVGLVALRRRFRG